MKPVKPWRAAVFALVCAACSKSTPAAEVAAPAEEVAAPEVVAPEVAAAPDTGVASAATPDAAAAVPDVAAVVPDAAVAPDAAAVVPDAAAVAPDAIAVLEVAAKNDRPVPPIGVYGSADDALLAYLEGTRKQDPERLWSVMSVDARGLMTQVLGKAKAAPEPELAKIGLTRGALESMTGREFFDHMVRQAPKPDPQPLLGELKVALGATPDRMVVSFTLGAAPGETRASNCQADAVKDAEGWKIEVSHCTSGP